MQAIIEIMETLILQSMNMVIHKFVLTLAVLITKDEKNMYYNGFDALCTLCIFTKPKN